MRGADLINTDIDPFEYEEPKNIIYALARRSNFFPYALAAKFVKPFRDLGRIGAQKRMDRIHTK